MTAQDVSPRELSTSSRALLEIIPAPIWLEDWSKVENFCQQQRNAGVTDLRSLLVEDETLLRNVISEIEILAVNAHTAAFVATDNQDDLLGNIPAGLLDRSSLDSLIEQIILVWEGNWYGKFEVNDTDLGGTNLDCELEWAAPLVDGKPDYSRIAVLVRDLREQHAEELRKQRSIERLETLLDMGRGIAATFDADLILDLLVDTATELVDAERSLILLVDDDATQLVKSVGRGVPTSEIETTSIDEAIAGWSSVAIRTREALRTDEIARDPVKAGPAMDSANVKPGMSAAIAPIIVDDRVLGTLTTLNTALRRPFTDEDLSLVKMLAAQAAVAMRNARFYEELSQSHEALQAAHLELQHTQAQLLGAQKMEAIGSLAAGIAHEINTPIQFVSDNVNFIKEGMKTLAGFAQEHAAILSEIVDHPELGERVRTVQARWKEEDCDFTIEEIPDAVEETLEGTRRVTEIVRAMKEFAHPGQEELTSTDINRVIENTVKVSRNEWKYVAEVEFDLQEDLPQIPALPGPLGQSILIMIVNSSQELAANRAIESEGKGTIKVRTRLVGDAVEIEIADDGPGIPPEILPRIFDPFFTTKEVGTGSGQGLSIAHSVIVDRHNGQIWAENLDPGALMVVRIPVAQPSKAGGNETDVNN